jgi:hypothetical protein
LRGAKEGTGVDVMMVVVRAGKRVWGCKRGRGG